MEMVHGTAKVVKSSAHLSQNRLVRRCCSHTSREENQNLFDCELGAALAKDSIPLWDWSLSLDPCTNLCLALLFVSVKGLQ